MNFIKTDEKIIETIASIAKRGGSLQKDIHRAACSILNRWCVTEDVSTATKHMNMLLDALPVMVRSNAFKDWGVHMAGLVWSEDDTFAYHAKRTKITVEQVQAAKAKPFWA
jgi:microsomal dipeptidase-like Zn-dependent dipeptidase